MNALNRQGLSRCINGRVIRLSNNAYLRTPYRHYVVCTASANASPGKDDTRKRPLVVLVGWLGAQQRHLRKYTHLWQSLGHPTLEVQPRTSSIVLPLLGDRQTAAFLNLLEHQRQLHQGRQLLLHIFSNAGFLFVGTALRQLALQDKTMSESSRPEAGNEAWLHQAAGIVFDSAPAQLTPDIAARGFVAAALGEAALHVEARHPHWVRAAATVFTPFLNSTYISGRAREVWEAWSTAAPTCPQLYLYSTDDALIPPTEIQDFQKLQATRGVRIAEKMWSGSAHCEHYRSFPDAYIDELSSFLSNH